MTLVVLIVPAEIDGVEVAVALVLSVLPAVIGTMGTAVQDAPPI